MHTHTAHTNPANKAGQPPDFFFFLWEREIPALEIFIARSEFPALETPGINLQTLVSSNSGAWVPTREACRGRRCSSETERDSKDVRTSHPKL